MATEQSCIELIYEKQRELNIDDFNLWLTDNYTNIVDAHRYEIVAAHECALQDENRLLNRKASLDYYNEFYG